jgi:hypothetical protein
LGERWGKDDDDDVAAADGGADYDVDKMEQGADTTITKRRKNEKWVPIPNDDDHHNNDGTSFPPPLQPKI